MAQGTHLTREIRSKGGKLSSRSTDIIGKSSRKDLARLTEYGMRQAKGWLDAVAKENPAQALKLWVMMLEYTHPKLSRKEAITLGIKAEVSPEDKDVFVKAVLSTYGNGSSDSNSSEGSIQD